MNSQLSTVFFSVTEFAKEVSVTPQAVRKAIKEGRLSASKIGKQWVIPKQFVGLWVEMRKK